MKPLYKGHVGDGSFVPYTVKPLYKGHAGDVSFVPYTMEPLYKGHVGDGSFVPYTVKPRSLQGTCWGYGWSEASLLVTATFVPLREVIPISEVTNVLSHYGKWKFRVSQGAHCQRFYSFDGYV